MAPHGQQEQTKATNAAKELRARKSWAVNETESKQINNEQEKAKAKAQEV